MPCTPSPSRLAKSSTRAGSPTRSRAASATARAIGCSEASSSAPASRSSSSSSVSGAVTTSRKVIRPVVTVPVLSSTTVSTRRVDSSTSGPRIRMPSCAPRPVPTMSAVGVASPRAQGQAMMRTATAAVMAALAPMPVPSQNPRVPTARAITTGTKNAETRSASRCTSALPCWASSTSRAICASWVSAPTLVARTTRRPPTLTVAPATASPGPTSTGTDSPVSMAASTADVPDSTTPSVAIFSPGRTTKRSPGPSSPTGTPHLGTVAQHGDVLGAQLHERPQRRACLALRAALEPATSEQERRDAGGGLEVDVAGAVRALDGQLEGMRHAGRPGRAPEQRVDRPAERRQRAERDQGVHRGRAVPQVERRCPVELPATPEDHRGGERQRQPLPGLHLQPRHHRHRDHGDRERGRDEEPVQGGVQAGLGRHRRRVGCRPRESGGVSGLLDGAQQVVGGDGLGVGDLRLLGGVVDRGDDTVELVELALDPGRARRAGHPGDRELDVDAHREAPTVNGAVRTRSPCLKSR